MQTKLTYTANRDLKIHKFIKHASVQENSSDIYNSLTSISCQLSLTILEQEVPGSNDKYYLIS